MRGRLHGNLPVSNLLTLLCWRGRDQGYLTHGLFRNNKRTKPGYWTCGSHSSHFYNTMAKASNADTQVICLLIFAIMSAIILLPLQHSLIYACINLKAGLLPSHCLASSPMELAPFLKIWQLMSAFMNMMHAVANLSQLGQVGGLRSLPLVRLLKTSEAQSRIQTLWSPSHVHFSLSQLSQRSQIPTDGGSNEPLLRVSPHLLSSWVYFPSVFLNMAPFTRLCIFPPC